MNLTVDDSSARRASSRVVRVLAAGTDDFYRAVALALDCTGIELTDTAASAESTLDKLARGGIDCVVIDKTIGPTNAFALCEQVEQKHRSPPAFVLFTEDAATRTVLAAFRAGLGDCVLHGRDYADELRGAILRAVARADRRRQLVDEIDSLARLAKSDRLTGLPNRPFLEDRLTSLAASSERHGGAVAAFLIDIDDFRRINEVHGHGVGDQALVAFGRRLKLTSRASDTVGRFGGDEFLYIVDRAVSRQTMVRVCERLVTALRFSVGVESIGLTLSASIGAACFPADASSTAELLLAAARALGAARDRPRRYCLAHDVGIAVLDYGAAGPDGTSGRVPNGRQS